MKEVADVCPLLSHEVHAPLIRREFNLLRLSQRSSGIKILLLLLGFDFDFRFCFSVGYASVALPALCVDKRCRDEMSS